jgi:ABC-2 type transport system permease protein
VGRAVPGTDRLAISFFEEVYSRNLGHLLATLDHRRVHGGADERQSDADRGRAFPTTIFAIWFFGFSLYSLGIALVVFFFSLMAFGWAIGLFVAGLVIDMGWARSAWAFIFALAPLCGVYYPISILPSWVQVASAVLPAAYVFEGMRAVLIDHTVRLDLMMTGVALNVVWLAVGIAGFLIFHRQARERGMLLQVGE